MPPKQQYRIALHFQENNDRYHYQAPNPPVREIAVIFPSDRDTLASA
jgi:hypothetical protein